MDFDPLLICYVFYLGKEKKKKRKQNIGKRLSVGLDHCISIAGCISRLNYCVAGGAVGG